MGDNCTVQKSRIKKEKEASIAYGAMHIVSICIPVSISMSLVLIVLKAIPSYTEPPTAGLFVPFSEDVSSTVYKTKNSLLNALVFIVVVVAMTLTIVFLYVYKCYRIIHTWLTFTTFFLLTLITFVNLKEAFLSFNYPIDIVTVSFGLWNFGTVGMIAIYCKAPKTLQQYYLIYTATLMSLMFVKLIPDWTSWMVLIILVIWDCLAVLCPRGPLRLLIDTAKQRSDTIPPSLIYVSFADFMVEDNVEQFAGREVLKTGQSSSGVKLGLGDFIFYGLLIGKASKYGDWFVIFSCFLAILVGLIATTILLSHYKRVMPALPISISLAVLIYFICVSCLCKTSAQLIKMQFYL